MTVLELIENILSDPTDNFGFITVKSLHTTDVKKNQYFVEAAYMHYVNNTIVEQRMRFNVRPFEIKRIESQYNKEIEAMEYTVYI